MTISEAYRVYDADVLYAGGMAHKTRRNYQSSLNSLLNALGSDIPIQLLAHTSISTWKQYMMYHGVQPSSMASNLSRLRAVLKYAKRRGVNVMDYDDVERPKLKRKCYTWLTVGEVGQFLDVIDSIRDKAIFSCLFSSGARISELLGLNRDSIVDGKAEIIGKGDKPGVLMFDDNCLHILNAYLETRKDRYRPLFLSSQNSRITVSRVEQLCHQYADLAGIDKRVTPHVFRHSFATDLRDKGMDIYDLSKQLRHERVSTTQIYVHSDDKREANYKMFHSNVPL